MKKITSSQRGIALLLATVLSIGNLLVLASPVSAASLTKGMVRVPRLATGQAANSGTNGSVLVAFQTSATGGGTTAVINMNGADSTTWTSSGGSVVNGATTVSSTGCATDATGATPISGTLSGSGVSASSTVTITTTTAMTANNYYCAYLTGASVLVNPTSAGTYHPTITVGGDSTTVAIGIVSNDQIVVTAVVPPTFSFSLGTNADTFTSNLSGTATATSGVTATVNTNAKNGWVAWAKDANTGLTSVAAGKTIASTTAGTAASLGSNTEGYSVGASITSQGTGAGTASVPAAYSGAQGGGIDTTLRQIASSTGTAASATFSVKEYAEVAPTTPAANDYTDTITVIGAGSF